MPYLKNISYLNWKAKMSALKITDSQSSEPCERILDSDSGSRKSKRHSDEAWCTFWGFATTKIQM